MYGSYPYSGYGTGSLYGSNYYGANTGLSQYGQYGQYGQGSQYGQGGMYGQYPYSNSK
jgi:hypothetical protein